MPASSATEAYGSVAFLESLKRTTTEKVPQLFQLSKLSKLSTKVLTAEALSVCRTLRVSTIQPGNPAQRLPH